MSIPPPHIQRLLKARPIYAELPSVQKGYADTEVLDVNEVLDSAYLVEFWEQRLAAWRVTAMLIRLSATEPTYLTSSQLDWLAPFFGWTGDYWSKDWNRGEKLALIRNSFGGVRIWDNKGSPAVIQALFRIFNLPFVLRPQNGFIVAVSIVGHDLIGTDRWNWQIVVPHDATPSQVSMAEWIIKYFTPFWSRVTVFRRTT